MAQSDWRCRDCGVDTDAIDEYYMVCDTVREPATHGTDGHLASDAWNAAYAALGRLHRSSGQHHPKLSPSTRGRPSSGCGTGR